MSRRQRVGVLISAVVLGSVLALASGVGAATHYPPGAACYDCHAVSGSKMVVGTRLIKKSQKTVDLGMGSSSTDIRCLFCHEANAVSVSGRTTMRGVWDHFKPTSRSKHSAVTDSTFTQDVNRFDCLDCHTGIAAGVVSDDAGNARVHGRDASATTHLHPYATLIGTPANDNVTELNANTCRASTCHDADGGAVGGYTAPPLHATAGVSINDQAVPLVDPDGTPESGDEYVSCTQCHGTHNSYQGDALIVLRINGSVSNNPAEPLSSLVTPEKCGECHTADDGGAASDFAARGHGRGDLTGGSLTCTNCHAATVPHAFSRDAVILGSDTANPMRFAIDSYDETTVSPKSALSGKATEGMCLLCHNTYRGKIHDFGGRNVSCQDCHEAHGKGMGSTGDYNTRMVRRQVPLNPGPATDTMIFKGVAAYDYWDENRTTGTGALGSSLGACDNMDCHGTLQETPIGAFVALAGSHSGGEVTTGAACVGCHSHNSTDGVWAAGAQACSNCHGYPPATNAHETHVATAEFGCENCHPGPGTTNHNEAGVSSATDFNAKWPLVRDKVDIAFAASPYPGGSYSYPKDARPDGNTDYGTCDTACHGSSLDVANQGTLTVPQWDRTAIALDPLPGDGACGTCHDVARDGDPANTPNTGNHLYHVATTAGNLGFGCQSCHVTTTPDGGSVIAGPHVDGQTTIAGGGSFSGVAVSLDFSDPTCSAVTCHGGYRSVAWGAASGNCANCHGTFASAGGMAGVVAKHKNADWSLLGFNTRHRGTAAPGVNGEGYCDWCHNNTQAVYDPARVSNAAAVGDHLDGVIQLNAALDYQGTSATGEAAAGCAIACHAEASPYGMSESNLPLDKTQTGQAFGCGACHNDATVPPTSGAHGIHLTAARGGVWTDTGDYTACESCHGNNGGAGYTIANGGSDADLHGDSITTFAAAVTYADPDGLPATADDTCLTTNCHSPNNAVPNTSNWAGVTPEASIGCDECHYWAAAPTRAANTANGNPLGGSHGDHFAGAARSRQLLCTDCHADNALDLGGGSVRSHISAQPGTDGAVLTARANAVQDAADLLGTVLGATGTNPDVVPWGLGATSNATCDNTQCHNPSNDGHLSPLWGAAATGSCETCHGGSSATPPPNLSHVGHAGNGGPGQFELSCSLCHNGTTTDGTTITGAGNHVNQQANVIFDTADARLYTGSTYGGTLTVGDTSIDPNDSCSDLYCHSNGAKRLPPFTAPQGGPLQWDVASTCNSCHNYFWGPSYANGTDFGDGPKANSHAKHGQNYGNACTTCHALWTGTTHVDGTYSVYDAEGDALPGDDFTFTPGAGGANGTCSSTNCHGGNAVAWNYDSGVNGPFTCDICHAEVAGAPTNTDVNNFTFQDWTQSKIAASGEYTSAGHGARLGGAVPTTPVGCPDCHDTSVNHDTSADLSGTNPFRLVAGFSCSSTATGCHPVGTLGTATGIDISTITTHSNEAMEADGHTTLRTWPAWDPACVNCHDPHGDGANLSMIQSEVYDKASFGLPAGPPPAEPTEQLNLTFTDNVTGADGTGNTYANTASPWSSLCQECHEASDHVSFRDGVSPVLESNHPGTDASPPGDCSVCHQHDNGFKPSGCNGCHGQDVSGQYWPDGAGGLPAYADDSPGSAASHASHVLAIGQYLGYGDYSANQTGSPWASMYDDAQQRTICAFCHFEPGGGGHTDNTAGSPVSQADVIGDGFSGGIFTAFDVAAQATKFDTNNLASYDATAKTCANVDCHYEAVTATYGGAGWNGGNTGDAGCDTCHVFAMPYTPGNLPNGHTIHVDEIADGGYGLNGGSFGCFQCHPAVIGGDNGHQNGGVDLVFTGALDPGNARTEAYSLGTGRPVKFGGTASTQFGSCSAFYCHGNFTGGVTANAPNWYNTDAAVGVGLGDGACGTCHVQPPVSGSHTAHVQVGVADVYGRTMTCTDCHPGADPVTHVNGAKNVQVNVGGTATPIASPTLLNGCGTNDCHESGVGTAAVRPYTWGTPLANDCASCHLAGTIATNAHVGHLGSNTLPGVAFTYNVTDECVNCHDTTTTGVGLAGGAGHLNDVADLSFTARSDYEAFTAARAVGTGGLTTCANVRCHSGVLTPAWGAGSIACGACHNYGGTEPAPVMNVRVAGSHVAHIDGLPDDYTDCAACHGNVGSYTATGGHANHMNLSVEVSVSVATYSDNVAVPGDAGGVNWIAGGTDHVDNGTCTFTSGCHGTGSPVWGGALAGGCFDCHAGTELAAKPTGRANSNPNPVSQSQYETAGHGQTGTFPGSTNTGPDYNYAHTGMPNSGCYECHSSGATHLPTASPTDPYRLGAAYAENTNALCATCHGVGGAATVIDLLSHTKAVTGSAYTWPSNYDYKCVDCHDPHGDANYMMVRSHINSPIGGTATVGSDNFGTPRDTTLAPVVFTNRTGSRVAGGYATVSDPDGICEVCHSQTVYFRAAGNVNETHNVGARCTSCHDHEAGFTGTCTSCHGGGLAAEGGENWWPDSEPTENGIAYPNRAGGHDGHVARIAEVANGVAPGAATTLQKNATCNWCHPNPGAARTGKSGETSHDDSGTWTEPADLYQDGVVAGETQYFKDILGDTDAGVATAAVNRKNLSTVYCSNVDCHYEGAEGSANATATFGTPNWYGGTVGCASCHREWTFGAAYNPGDLPTAHDVHTDDAAYMFNCFTCHPMYFSMAHQDGVVDLNYQPSRIGGGVIDTNAVFSGGDRTVKYGGSGTYVSCQNFYCHGDRAGGNNATPVWNGTAACGTCHGTTAAADSVAKSYPRTGGYVESHREHVESNTDPGCSGCHEGAGALGLGTYEDVLNHVKGGVVDLIFGAAKGETETVRYEGTAVVYNDTVGNGAATGTESCTNVRCHNGVTTPAFDLASGVTPDIACGDCHSDTWNGATANGPLPTGAASVAGNHVSHANNDGVYTDCTPCHANAVSYTATGGHADHMSLSVEVSISVASYTDNVAVPGDAGGVNWIAGGTDHVDNGTCAFTSGCHGSGTQQWGGTLAGGCFGCHAGTELAEKPAGRADGSPNPVDQIHYESAGHGQTGTFPGSTNTGPDYRYDYTGTPNSGCYECHSSGATHMPTASPTDPYRLGAAYAQDTNALCATCHALLDIQSHTQAVTSSTYTWPDNYNYKCVDCHDPHGDANYMMVRSHINSPVGVGQASTVGSDNYGTPRDTTLAPVTFTDRTGNRTAGGYTTVSDPDGVCEVCHSQTDYFRADGTMPEAHNVGARCTTCHTHDRGFAAGCNTCHGYPPVQAGQVSGDDLKLENYAGGGGMHLQHVQFLQGKLPGETGAKALCGPCHGDGAGSTDHNGARLGEGSWNISARTEVNIRSRATGNSWDGMVGDPVTPSTYGGVAITGTAVGANAAVNSTNSRCVGVDCHGNPASADPDEVLWWNVNLAAGSPGPGNEESRTCEGCHDQTPAQVRVYNAAGTGVYTGGAPNAAAAYYGTLSGYSKGGHGDPTINSTDDPSFVESGTGSTPLECAACHSAAVAHFPEPATGNIHRLANTTLETASHTGLCNDCHTGSAYPGTHHPSYEGTWASTTTDVIPAGGQEIYTVPSTWTDQGGGHYEQDGYSASAVSGNVDYFVDWWSGSPSSAPRPSPLATLPLEGYVLGTETSTRVMCVTCHNPHGTDLYTYDPSGTHQDIPANRMLRLRDSDNTLCNACHE